jgi:hypothetical protein
MYGLDMKVDAQVAISPLQKTYLRFVELLQVARGFPDFPDLDEIDRSLLNQIALHFFEGKPLLVSDLIYSNKTASTATLHRRLSKLLKEDLIRHGSDIDGRKKYLELTPKSRDYFTKVGECVRDAAR